MCVLYETLSGEPIASKALNKINRKPKFVYHKNKFLISTLFRMLCNALIKPHFACSVWYLNLSEKLKTKIWIAQNKCIHLCLKLDKRHHISNKLFESINWLFVYKRVHQFINAITFKLVIKGAYIKYVGERAGGYYKFCERKYVAQETIDLNISWPSNFFRKNFMAPPINFNFLFQAYL